MARGLSGAVLTGTSCGPSSQDPSGLTRDRPQRFLLRFFRGRSAGRACGAPTQTESTLRTPGRWLGGTPRKYIFARCCELGPPTARLVRRGGNQQISPAGEVPIRSPRAGTASLMIGTSTVPAWPDEPSKIVFGMDTKCYGLCMFFLQINVSEKKTWWRG